MIERPYPSELFKQFYIMPQEKWIILHNAPDVQPAWFCNDKPVLWYTEKEAMEDLLDDKIADLQNQLDEVRRGDRQPDEVDMEPGEWVEKCTVHDDGSITIPVDEVIYNPKTFIR